MAQVTVMIDGKAYRMACEDGQEDHLRTLGGVVDAKIAEMRANFGEIGDARLTIMAAIVLADELSEAQRRVDALDSGMERMRTEHAASRSQHSHGEAGAAATLDALTSRLERLATDLARLADGGRADADEE